MKAIAIAILTSAAACADQPDITYQREDGTVVTVEPCEDSDIMCLDILDANVVLDSSTVEHLELAALLRGPFDDGSAYSYGGANLVKPEYIDDANDSYGSLTRYPLALQFVPGEAAWHSGQVTHLVDAGTDGTTLQPLCGTTLFAEVSLGAPSTSVNHGAVMSSTTWLKTISFSCQ